MNNVPKALMRIDEETFLERVVRTCQEGGCEQIWVVIRPGVPELAALAASLPVHVVVNPDPERGMFSSVQCGMQTALGGTPKPSAVVIFPVDHPRVTPTTVTAVQAALKAHTSRACVQPSHHGKPGHPIAIDRQAAQALLLAPPLSTLREVLRDLGIERHLLPVNDSGILANLNTPES